MRTRTLLLFATLLSSTLAFGFICDEDPLKTLLEKLEKFRRHYPQEKVHIHLDKPYYSVGDTIWFKAYLVNAEKNQLSSLSKILYVELINEKGTIKESLRLPVTAGLSRGDFTLSDSLTEGNYRIRAYTTWMRNFGEDYFFDKIIPIGNALSNKLITNTSYTFSKIGNTEKVEATIIYTDINGDPIAQKEVAYDVQLNFRNISKGKGTTDKNGKLKLTFINNQPFILKSGTINTSIKLAENSVVQKSIPVKATSDAVDLQFFPEGGQLVNKLRSRVAFKAVTDNGLGTSASGYIINKNKDKVASFKTDHAGMGSFTFTPDSGNNYTAIATFSDGSEKKIPLPQAVNEGYVLSVNNTDTGSVTIRIAASPRLVNGSEVIVVAQSNQVIQYVSKAKLETPVLHAKVPRKRFPTGILQVTLFSPKYQPVAERLVFIDNNEDLKINITTDKDVYVPGEKVKMAVDVKDFQGNPVQGSFSLAVTDLSKVPYDLTKETSILSNLLLTSDIPGYIEDPNYYFINTNEDKIRQLDNLMLTQGWRRFLWKNILSDTDPIIAFNPEQGIEISGRVTAPNGKPVEKGQVTLHSTSGDNFALDTLTNKEGYFRFAGLNFTSETNFVVQAYNAKGRKNVDIDLYQQPPQLVTPSKNYPNTRINVNNSILPYLKNSKERFDELKRLGLGKQSIVLSEVKVVDKKPAVKNSANLNGAGNADQVVRVEQLANCTSLVQCLNGLLVGVIFSNGVPISTRGGVMNVMVDGIFSAPDYLNYITPEDVESIEVLRNVGYLAIYGIHGGNGIIMVNTKRGERNLNGRKYARGTLSYSPQGYYIGREFYSPKYAAKDDNSKIKDLRTTLFWKPNIVTDSAGKASVEFFNSGSPGSFQAVIEGISLDGTLGRKVYSHSVKQGATAVKYP